MEKIEFTSFSLHILAMFLMLLDHMWATVMSGNMWMTCVGRLAFPIFAFMIAEGAYYTHDMKKYIRRMLIWALISEIPFNLMMGGGLSYIFHQNVMFTFLYALLAISAIQKARISGSWVRTFLVGGLVTALFYLLGFVTFVDYYGYGVLTVLLFYFFRGRKWWQMLLQLAGLICINWFMIDGMMLDLNLFGRALEIPEQGLAVFAIIPIWLYRGRQGIHNKWTKYGFYAFYPAHMLILALIALYLL